MENNNNLIGKLEEFDEFLNNKIQRYEDEANRIYNHPMSVNYSALNDCKVRARFYKSIKDELYKIIPELNNHKEKDTQ